MRGLFLYFGQEWQAVRRQMNRRKAANMDTHWQRISAVVVAVLFLLSGALIAQETREIRAKRATVLRISDAIGPASSDYVQRGIRTAADRGDALIILKLDTPGGLDSAMRDIVRAILAAPIPVVTFVAPSGARAASAGTYIVYASHIAAMAPATNLGAATPVQIGGFPSLPGSEPPKLPGKEGDFISEDESEKSSPPPTAFAPDAMTKKIVNDAAAYIQGLARMRGRNERWAEQSVREAESLAAEDALKRNVIDIIAVNDRDLIDQLDGRVLTVNGIEVTLVTEDMMLDEVAPDWRTELLAVITSANVAYILMLLGIYGLFFELANPGAVVPGVVGAICLLVAMFSLQMLPVNYAGLALVLLGIAFMIGELFMPSFGALGMGGVIAFAIGSLILFDSDSQQFRVSISLVIALTLLTAGFFLIAVRSLVRARQGPIVSGQEQLVGSLGEALEDFDSLGQIRVHGEIWNAAASGPMKRGEQVRVTAIDGLTLTIVPLEEKG